MQTSLSPKYMCSAHGCNCAAFGAFILSPTFFSTVQRVSPAWHIDTLEFACMPSSKPLSAAELLHKFNYHFQNSLSFFFFPNLVLDSFLCDNFKMLFIAKVTLIGRIFRKKGLCISMYLSVSSQY